MKHLLVLLLMMFTKSAVSQQWVTDENYDRIVTGSEAFEDGHSEIIVVEFWADFNKENAFLDWKKFQLIVMSYYPL